MNSITFFPYPPIDLCARRMWSATNNRGRLFDLIVDGVASEAAVDPDRFDTMRALMPLPDGRDPLDCEEVTVLLLDDRAIGTIDRELTADEWRTALCQIIGPQDNPWERHRLDCLERSGATSPPAT